MESLLRGCDRPIRGVASRRPTSVAVMLTAAAMLVALVAGMSGCGEGLTVITDTTATPAAPGTSEASATSAAPVTSDPGAGPVLPETMPDDFGFIAWWGVGAKNSIDTFAGTVVKDRVTEPSASGPLVLSAETMQNLYQDLRSMEETWQMFSAGLNFDPDPFSDIYPPGVTVFVTPYMSYRLDWSGAGFESVHAEWEDSMLSPEPKAVALREWFHKLMEIVRATPEWQALPPEAGGYAAVSRQAW